MQRAIMIENRIKMNISDGGSWSEEMERVVLLWAIINLAMV